MELREGSRGAPKTDLLGVELASSSKKYSWNFQKNTFDDAGQINGDFSKILRGMKIERPSLLQSSVSTPVSDIFVRELIQNSWDSADDQGDISKKYG